MKKVLFAMLGFLTVNIVQAQEEEITDSVQWLSGKIETAETEIGLLKKLKFSGYIQAQWQKADTIGSPSVAGGDFKGTDNRFQVRRARLKAAYSGTNSNIAMQLDLKDDGSVKVKEAYGIYTEPLLNAFSLTGGIFNRPIGFEVEYSSSTLESPERARVLQTLFPDECDLGAKLTIQAPKTSSWNFLKLDVGLFNGNAITSETDKFKDLIAHLSFKKVLMDENLQISGGISYYLGGFASPPGTLMKWNSADSTFKADAGYKKGDRIDRKYFGIDAQISLNSALGLTSLRAEYLWGQQPGTFKSTVSPKGAITDTKDYIIKDTLGNAVTYTATVKPDIYLRNFNGGYVMLVHRLMQTKHEIVAKYDWYDPNTDASGDELVSKNKNVGPSDLKFTTIGLGYNYYATPNVRLSVYYDMVSNEKLNAKYNKAVIAENGVKNYTSDLKDNVLTLRVLYKF